MIDQLLSRAVGESNSQQAARAIRWAWQALLLGWFAWLTWQRIGYFVAHDFPLGIDARIYYRGVITWLAGGNPWTAGVDVHGSVYHYAGSPVTTVLLAPAALVSEDLFTAIWLVLSAGAIVWTLHRVHLPLWWLLFPPISEALFSGNPQLVVLALILSSSSWLAAIGTGLKVYAFVPLAGEGRWRAIGVAVVLNAATILVAPGLWSLYLAEFGEISTRLQYESLEGFSAFYMPALLLVVVVALAVLALRDRRAAGWLAVPAIWPASQLHYSTMALPVMTPLLAFFLAIPMLRLPPLIILVEIIRRLLAPTVVGWIRAAACPPGRLRPQRRRPNRPPDLRSSTGGGPPTRTGVPCSSKASAAIWANCSAIAVRAAPRTRGIPSLTAFW